MRWTTIPHQAANHDPRPSRKPRAVWRLRFSAALCLLACSAGAARAEGPFALRDGDRVVFYGDSITDQRLYTTFVETYVVTRFPG